jgi:subtilisin-like proprotein convertase family protein
MRNIFNATRKTFLTLTTILTIFAGLALADNINLDMEGSTATIPKGNTVERKIFGIPSGIPGDLKIKLKWHAVNLIPNTFNRLKVQVLHGSDVLKTTNCYSIHSNKTPKCSFTIAVSQAEANQSGSWKLKVTNNSNDEVISFNIEKGGDVNPMVQSFRSVYTPDCPNTVNLDMEGTTLTLGKGNTQERRIFGIGNAPGVLKLKAKWHAVNLIPNTFNALKIQLIKPNGDVAVAATYHSFHSNKSSKFNITYNITAQDAALSGNWKLKITNNSNDDVIGFNIEKESGEINPLVPSFFSSYKANCQ